MAKQIVYGEESRQAILRGVNALANAVKVTLGPPQHRVAPALQGQVEMGAETAIPPQPDKLRRDFLGLEGG